MPSTLVHAALAGLVGTALLAEHFDGKAVLAVMLATVAIDLDVFVGLVVPGTHRAAFHTLVLPAIAAGLLYWDLRVRERSAVRSRWGARGVRVAWVGVFAVTVAGIGLDAFFNGANLLYPIHDQFYTVNGKLVVSDQRGVVQTYVEWGAEATGSGGEPATTENTHYRTGVDPERGTESQDTERVFHVVHSGVRLLLTLVGFSVVGMRVWMERRAA